MLVVGGVFAAAIAVNRRFIRIKSGTGDQTAVKRTEVIPERQRGICRIEGRYFRIVQQKVEHGDVHFCIQPPVKAFDSRIFLCGKAEKQAFFQPLRRTGEAPDIPFFKIEGVREPQKLPVEMRIVNVGIENLFSAGDTVCRGAEKIRRQPGRTVIGALRMERRPVFIGLHGN